MSAILLDLNVFRIWIKWTFTKPQRNTQNATHKSWYAIDVIPYYTNISLASIRVRVGISNSTSVKQ